MKRIAAVALLIALLPSVAYAAARIELVNSAATVETRNGALVSVPLTGSARPGERIRYTIVAKNNGDHAAAKLVPVTKIPAGVHYVGGSAGPFAEFSIDGGKTWARQPMVSVTTNGALTQRPALASEYNAIHWLSPAPLAPGAKMAFAYDVVVE